MEKYFTMARAEYANGCELEKRLAECGSTLSVYEEDRLLVGHLLDFVENNLELYAEHIKQELEQ